MKGQWEPEGKVRCYDPRSAGSEEKNYEHRMVVTKRDGGYVGERVQTSIYKMNEFWGSNEQHGDCS